MKKLVLARETRTENGMKAFKSTTNACVDFFFKAGASRGKDVIPYFVAALSEDKLCALKIALWARDIRGGAGERQIFRDILIHLASTDRSTFKSLIPWIPEVGRWDDLWSAFGIDARVDNAIISFIVENRDNGLLCKWLPRKRTLINGKDFTKAVREALRLRPKEYRKYLVRYTSVVETQMCEKKFDEIAFRSVPSKAHNLYRKAFIRNAPVEYSAYVSGLKKKETKISAGAVYPYELISSLRRSNQEDETSSIVAQWEALPNYLGERKMLAVVDTSGSMTVPVAPPVTALDVALSIGLYAADKNSGPFADLFVTFSSSPEFQTVTGDISQKILQIKDDNWEMNTNLSATLNLILNFAVKEGVTEEDMPDSLIILSDMQFDSCVSRDDSALEMMRRKYELAGYEVPNIIFWNLRSSDNVPARFNQQGVALVSGFSPAIFSSLFSGDLSPEKVMDEALVKYDIKLS